jgi:hypothetical protein
MVPNHVLNGGVIAPDDAIGVVSVDPGGGDPFQTLYDTRYQIQGNFPDSELTLAEMLNDGYSDNPDHALPGHEYGPFEAVDFSTDENSLYYTNFIANYWLNVKTWKVTGEVGAARVSATIPAGTRVTDSDPNPTRPNSGKRGAYIFGCNIGSTGGDDDEDNVSVVINPFISLTSPTATYYQGPTPYLAMPFLYIEMQGGGSSVKVTSGTDIQSSTSPSEDSNVTMLGQPMQTQLTNSPTGYSLEIEAHEWWTTEEWITESDWASQT